MDVIGKVIRACERIGAPPPQVVMFSDHRYPSDREKSLQAGAADFMGKPVRFTDLLQVLEAQLQLEWINEAAGESRGSAADVPKPEDWVLPPIKEIHALEDIVRTGNVRKLREALEKLEENPKWKPFCEPLLTFCAGYRLNTVREKLRDAKQELKRRGEA